VKKFPGGDWYAKDARKIFAPPKDKVLTSMEELIQNFMIVTEGPQMPAGEVYFEAENPKGVLGFYIVSKGGGVPYRMKIRSPSFCNLSILPNSASATSCPTSSPSSARSTSSWASATGEVASIQRLASMTNNQTNFQRHRRAPRSSLSAPRFFWRQR
jgi:hypothetical protein